MLVRRESPDRPADARAIRAVTEAAFGRPDEADLVDALRASPQWLPHLSLVVESDGRILGHVVCSRGHVGGAAVLGLAPLSVDPPHQGSGVGSALMHAVLAAAEATGESLVGLLGAPAYYRRFGFQAAAGQGVEAPDPAWGEHFQVRVLDATRSIRGRFGYAPAFDAVS